MSASSSSSKERIITFTTLDSIDSWSSYYQIRGRKRRRREDNGSHYSFPPTTKNGGVPSSSSSSSIVSSVKQTIQTAKETNSHYRLLCYESDNGPRSSRFRSKPGKPKAGGGVSNDTTPRDYGNHCSTTKRKVPSCTTRLQYPPIITLLQASAQIDKLIQIENASSTIAMQSSLIRHPYDKIQRCSSERKNWIAAPSSDSIHIPLIQTDYIVNINLTQLLDPPLWLSGIIDTRVPYDNDTNCEYGFDCEDQADQHENRDRIIVVSSKSESMESVLETLLYHGACSCPYPNCDDEKAQSPYVWRDGDLIRTNGNTKEGILGPLNQEILQSLKQMNTTSWLHLLPSQVFMHRIKTIYRMKELRSCSILMVGLSALTLLANVCYSDALGRHILSILAPAMYDPSFLRRSDKKGISRWATKQEWKIMRELATLIVYKCKIGNGTKVDLRNLMQGVGVTDAARFFVLRMGDAFYGYCKHRKCMLNCGDLFSTKGNKEVGILGPLSQEILQFLKQMNTTSWLRLLPSQVFMHRIKTIYRKELRSCSILMVGLSALTLLAKVCYSDALGRHILSILAPAMFDPSFFQLSDKKGISRWAKEQERELMRELATLIVYKCKFGNLKKVDLRKLMQGVGVTDAARFFVLRMGDAFYGYCKHRKCRND